jgi:hypothetical protein
MTCGLATVAVVIRPVGNAVQALVLVESIPLLLGLLLGGKETVGEDATGLKVAERKKAKFHGSTS